MPKSRATTPVLLHVRVQRACLLADVEVLDAMFARAQHFARIGDKEAAYAAFEAIQARVKISTGRRIDAAMSHTRVSHCKRTSLSATVCLVYVLGCLQVTDTLTRSLSLQLQLQLQLCALF